MTIFQDIINTRSFTSIEYQCEDALDSGELTPIDAAAIKAILASSNLDERHALAHEQLGNHDKAAELRAWAAGAAHRKAKSLTAM